jgi:hypothetical protein
MTAADIRAALTALDGIDLEVARARDAYAKFEHVARQGPSVPHWELNSPPGHLPQGDKDRLVQLARTVEVATACRDAAAGARLLLTRQLERQLEEAQ